MPYSLDDMMKLARSLLAAEQAEQKAEQALKDAAALTRTIREETLPCAMQELGVEKLTLKNGAVLTLKPEVYCAIPKDSQDEAFAWLIKHKHGGLIKTEVSALFGKGQLKQANAMLKLLRKAKANPEWTRSVHAGTLKAFLREQIEAKQPIPMSLFGARSVFEVTVKGLL